MTDVPGGRSNRAPIHFKEQGEFEARPNYSSTLLCSSDQLDYIVGKYGFSADKKLQCGLNGCNKWHWHGFVIATKEGAETHCGQDCGKREFKVSWDEIHAVFERQEKAETRRNLVTGLLEERNDLLRLALDRQQQLAEACAKVRAVYDELRKEGLLARQFENALASGGRILAEAQEDKKVAQALGQRGRGANLTTIGRILGRLAPEKYQSIGRTFEWSVVRPLQGLDEKSVESMSDDRIEDISKSINTYRLELSAAEQFLEASRHFLSLENLAEIEKLKLVLPARAKTSRLERIFARLPAYFNVE